MKNNVNDFSPESNPNHSNASSCPEDSMNSPDLSPTPEEIHSAPGSSNTNAVHVSCMYNIMKQNFIRFELFKSKIIKSLIYF